MKSALKYINSSVNSLFREMQEHQIKAKEQIEFVMDLYADFKYFDYAEQDDDNSKFNRVEKQRERALEKAK